MFNLSKPEGNEAIAKGNLAYASTKLRKDLHGLILRALRREGISQSDLAQRLGKKKSYISRVLGAPGNWTIDTASELMFAISGNFVKVSELDANSLPLKNNTTPEWLGAEPHKNCINFRPDDIRSNLSSTSPNVKISWDHRQ